MQYDSVEDCAGRVGGASQDGISVLDELCMGSQLYDEMGCGSMQLALIGDGCPLDIIMDHQIHTTLATRARHQQQHQQKQGC